MWTKEEINFLTENCNKIGRTKICKILHKSYRNLNIKIKELNLKIKVTKWTDEEIKILENNYKKASAKELSKILNRSIDAINAKLEQLKLYKKIYWTEKEIEILKQYYEIAETDEILINLFENRSILAINLQAEKLGLRKRYKVNRWTKEEEQFLIENWYILTKEEICKKINKSINAIWQKARQLGIKERNEWTNEELDILKNNYEKMTAEELSKIVKHSVIAIRMKASNLKLIKHIFWTIEELEILANNYETTDTKTITKLIKNHAPVSINVKARQLGLKRINKSLWTEKEINILKEIFYKTKEIEKIKEFLPNKSKWAIKTKIREFKLKRNQSKLWTDEEIKLLIEVYPNNTFIQLMEIFPNKTKAQTSKKAQRLKLRKSKEILDIYFKSGKKPTCRQSAWRRKILKRDNYCCQECGFRDETGLELQAHHIIPKRDVEEKVYDIDNGICLCFKCHDRIRNKEHTVTEKYQLIVEAKKQ